MAVAKKQLRTWKSLKNKLKKLLTKTDKYDKVLKVACEKTTTKNIDNWTIKQSRKFFKENFKKTNESKDSTKNSKKREDNS